MSIHANEGLVPEKRLRGASAQNLWLATVIAAAAKQGRHLVGVVTRPDHSMELRFARGAPIMLREVE